MRKIFPLLGVLAISLACWAQSAQSGQLVEPRQSTRSAQSAARAEILVLGTYHMANPGHDIYNLQADDVLSPKRQQEIAQLLGVLKRFHPTKIAIESDAGSPRAAREYSDYLAEKYTLSGNETNQIGYRLAKELGQQAIYAVDVEGDFPIQRVTNYAKAHGRSEQLETLMASFGARVKQENDFLRSHTVLEMLQYMNSDAMAAEEMSSYYVAVSYSEAGDYAGPDLLAAWYQRNIRIYSNIVKLIESPNDRILVIYGAGHLAWLRQDAANDASVKLRKLAELTGQQ